MGGLQLLFWLGWRHVRAHALRTFITMSGIAVGISMLTAITALNNGILDAFKSMLERASNGVHLVVGGGGQAVDEALLEDVLGSADVERASSVVEFVGTVREQHARLMFMGLDLMAEHPTVQLAGKDEPPVLEEPLAFMNSRENMLLSRSFAAQHGLKVGDHINVEAPGGMFSMVVYGLVTPQGPTSAFGGAMAIVSLDVGQLLAGMQGRVSRMEVVLKDGVDVESAAGRLEALLGSRASVQQPAQLGAMGGQVTGVFRRGLQMSSFVTVLVAFAIIYNTVLISVLQRRREWGILRALGAQRGNVVRQVVAEAALLGLGGSLGGMFTGWAMASLAMHGAAEFLSNLYLPIHGDSASLPPWMFVVAPTLGVVAAMLAAWVPASRAAEVSPTQAMSRSDPSQADAPVQVAVRVRWALILFAGSVLVLDVPMPAEDIIFIAGACAAQVFGGIFVITPVALLLAHRMLGPPMQALFGITGRLAVDNMLRTLSRGSANVASLAGAALTVVAMGTYVESFSGSLRTWISQTMVADLMVTVGADTVGSSGRSMPGEALPEIAALDGVEAAVGIRTVPQVLHGSGVRLRAVDSAAWLKRVKLPASAGVVDAAAMVDVEHPGILVSDTVAQFHGVQPGQELMLASPSGRRSYRVLAVVADYASPLGTITMDRAEYVRAWHDPLLNSVEVFLKLGSDAGRVRDALMASSGTRHGLWATTNADFKDAMDTAVRSFFGLTQLLIVLAMLVSVLGIMVTLQADVVDRVREIGMLRAIGALRSQVQRAVTLQALGMTLTSVAVGSLAGMLLGWRMIESLMRAQTGWKLPFVMPWVPLLLVFLVAPVAALLSAWAPSRAAARLVVSNALSHE